MKHWIVALVAAMMAVTVQAAEFSGKLTAIESDTDGNYLIIDGNEYRVAADTVISVRMPDGSEMFVSFDRLEAGSWVRYGLSNQAGTVGELASVQVSGPAHEVKRLIDSAP